MITWFAIIVLIESLIGCVYLAIKISHDAHVKENKEKYEHSH